MVSTSSILQSSIRPLRIGMIGAGTVGGGVYEIIMNRLGSRSAGNNTTASGAKKQVVITKICVRDPTKPRDFQNDKRSTEIVTDINSIVNDKDIDLVVEVMGGTSLAKSAVLESLKQGKSVVTANKALIAENLEEIVGVLNQVNERVVGKEAVTAGDGGNVKFAYEASVCGGIPVIQVLQSCYTGDIINEVMVRMDDWCDRFIIFDKFLPSLLFGVMMKGICNGTTNFMLGKMEAGADYDEVLKEAQDLGFAEADPSADVDGYGEGMICVLLVTCFVVIIRLTTCNFSNGYFTRFEMLTDVRAKIAILAKVILLEKLITSNLLNTESLQQHDMLKF